MAKNEIRELPAIIKYLEKAFGVKFIGSAVNVVFQNGLDNNKYETYSFATQKGTKLTFFFGKTKELVYIEVYTKFAPVAKGVIKINGTVDLEHIAQSIGKILGKNPEEEKSEEKNQEVTTESLADFLHKQYSKISDMRKSLNVSLKNIKFFKGKKKKLSPALSEIQKELDKEEKTEGQEGDGAEASEIKLPSLKEKEILYSKKIDMFFSSPKLPKYLMVFSGSTGLGKTEDVLASVKKNAGGFQTRYEFKTIPAKEFEKPANKEKYVELAKFLINTGPAPTEGAMKVYEGASKHTEESLFTELFNTNGNAIVYDDKGLLDNQALLDILLNATDTGKDRVIRLANEEGSWKKLSSGSYIPTSFKYTGRIFVITNKSAKEFPPAIRSRATVLDFDLTPKQMAIRIKSRLPEIKQRMRSEHGKNIPDNAFTFVYNFVAKLINDGHLKQIDIRTYRDLVFDLYQLKSKTLWEKFAYEALHSMYGIEGVKFVN